MPWRIIDCGDCGKPLRLAEDIPGTTCAHCGAKLRVMQGEDGSQKLEVWEGVSSAFPPVESPRAERAIRNLDEAAAKSQEKRWLHTGIILDATKVFAAVALLATAWMIHVLVPRGTFVILPESLVEIVAVVLAGVLALFSIIGKLFPPGRS